VKVVTPDVTGTVAVTGSEISAGDAIPLAPTFVACAASRSSVVASLSTLQTAVTIPA
jgi:hypothetical protein